jgi:hypothetical protein
MRTFGIEFGRQLLSATLIIAALALGGAAIGADATANAEPAAQVDTSKKLKLKGVVTRRDADTFTVRDMNGVDTT